MSLQNLSEMTFFDNHQGEGRVCYASDFGSECFITSGEVHPNDSQACSRAEFGLQIPVLQYVYSGQITSDVSISLNLYKECNDCLSGCPGITPVRVQLSSNSEIIFEQTDYAFDSTYEFDVVLEPESLVRLAVFPEDGCHCDSTQYRLVIRDTSQLNDCDGNGILDQCDPDLDEDSIPDASDADIDGDGVPNECDVDTQSEPPHQGAIYWDPAVGGNGHWYLISSELQLDWSAAADRSHAKGGHLASITSPEENQFLIESYEQNSLSLTPWIGLIRDATVPEESWIWYTGEPVVWTNWSPGNPDFDNEVQANIYLWSESPSGNPGCCPLVLGITGGSRQETRQRTGQMVT